MASSSDRQSTGPSHPSAAAPQELGAGERPLHFLAASIGERLRVLRGERPFLDRAANLMHGDYKSSIGACFLAGDGIAALQLAEAAVDEAWSAAEAGDRSSAPLQLPVAYLYLGQANAFIGHHGEAVECFNTCLDLVRSEGRYSQELRIEALVEGAKAYWRMGQLDRALDSIAKGLGFFDAMVSPSEEERASLVDDISELGEQFVIESKDCDELGQKGLELIKAAVERSSAATDAGQRSRHRLAEALTALEDFEGALRVFASLRGAFESVAERDPRQQALVQATYVALREIGILIDLGRLPQAADLVTQGFQRVEQFPAEVLLRAELHKLAARRALAGLDELGAGSGVKNEEHALNAEAAGHLREAASAFLRAAEGDARVLKEARKVLVELSFVLVACKGDHSWAIEGLKRAHAIAARSFGAVSGDAIAIQRELFDAYDMAGDTQAAQAQLIEVRSLLRNAGETWRAERVSLCLDLAALQPEVLGERRELYLREAIREGLKLPAAERGPLADALLDAAAFFSAQDKSKVVRRCLQNALKVGEALKNEDAASYFEVVLHYAQFLLTSGGFKAAAQLIDRGMEHANAAYGAQPFSTRGRLLVCRGELHLEQSQPVLALRSFAAALGEFQAASDDGVRPSDLLRAYDGRALASLRRDHAKAGTDLSSAIKLGEDALLERLGLADPFDYPSQNFIEMLEELAEAQLLNGNPDRSSELNALAGEFRERWDMPMDDDEE